VSVFDAKFGVGMTRDALITWVESEAKEKELAERVKAKWEDIELSIRSNRKKRYE
jgi:hypothetical protein